jgi:hypothetical protein
MRLRVILFLAFFVGSGASGYASGFRAAAVEVDITPTTPQWLLGYGARQSDGVHDHIFHRIAALDDGHRTFYIVSSELALFSPGYCDRVLKDVQDQLGIAPADIWWTVTHTHSAPAVGPPGVPAIFMPERYKQAGTGDSNPEYTRFVETKLIEGLRLARESLRPARLGIGTGFSLANINRRAKDEDGQVSLGLNPDGPTDRQIGLLRMEGTDGKLIGLIANYAIHGTDLGHENLKISGDVPGIVAQYVEQKLGAPMLFLNGAEGNLAPIYSVYPDPTSGHLGEFRVLLGDRILQADREISETTSDVVLTPGEHLVETPLRVGLGWPPELKKYTRTLPGGGIMVRIPVRFLQINQDTVLWGAPVEMFCEIATDVRSRSPYPFTFYVGLLNGWLGYLPTAQAIHDGGYEPATSPFTDRAEQDMREQVVTQLDEMIRTAPGRPAD